MNDDELARLYEDPENRRIQGPGRRQARVGITLSNGAVANVPRRFLGGQPLTVSSSRFRVWVDWAVC